MEDKQLVIYVSSGIAITLVTTVFILYLTIRERKRYLQQQNRLELLEAEKQQDVLKAVIRTTENERRRIARDLHDSVGSSLSMVKLGLSARLHAHPGKGEEFANHETLEKIDEVISSIRAACFQLYPVSLAKYGLNAMMEDTLSNWHQTTGIGTKFKNQILEEKYGDSLEFKLNFFRVFEEVVNNIVKHGQCSSIEVTAAQSDSSKCIIRIVHNGKPFSDEQARTKRNEGIGLSSISSRLNLLDGIIEYKPGASEQSVLITVPLPNG